MLLWAHMGPLPPHPGLASPGTSSGACWPCHLEPAVAPIMIPPPAHCGLASLPFQSLLLLARWSVVLAWRDSGHTQPSLPREQGRRGLLNSEEERREEASSSWPSPC